jgi:phosphatidylserine/phosphatidylglycerophosphate/cardiolipin synthase-like enzyme
LLRPALLIAALVAVIVGALLVALYFRAAKVTSNDNEAVLPPVETAANVETCFTPAEHCVGSIVAIISAAKSQIRVQAYGFTSDPIATALVAAHQRGIDVEVILDKSNERASNEARGGDAGMIARAGLPVFIDYRPAIAHNKVMIVDEHIVVTGSYNFTAAAEQRNAENVTIIDSRSAAERFLENWRSRKALSRPFVAADDQ